MKLVGLSRQLAITMASIALAAVLMIILTSFGFYYMALTYWPETYQANWFPTWAEALWLFLTTLAGIALAVLVAGHVAKRILVPLNAVADGIRRVAHGDLSVRAVVADRSMGEAAALVDDFNHLADRLQRATEERAFWNAAIAHELRTPVTILRGRIQGLADGVFEADGTQFRRLLLQVEGLARLIEDLRAVSLAESGHLALQWQEACLSRDIEETAESFRESFASKGQQLVLDLQAVQVWCDPMRIRQALLALLDNARRHASPGAITVRSRTVENTYLLTVEDQGPGIDPELAPHVFEAFRRAAKVEEGRDRGSGLGLAVVATITQAHGGQAHCEPTGTGGTRFAMQWPLSLQRP
ncbi:ATP-binding protein [Massilia sp.]|uniref:ATP-binding protein n=1 Tax=Massilia sp. TaxID=1882437 RepID=UPI0028AF7684|nr:ATP-binding protein [Massilia sp.]